MVKMIMNEKLVQKRERSGWGAGSGPLREGPACASGR